MVELPKDKIPSAHALLHELDASGVLVTAAVWYFAPEFEAWRLLLELPEYDALGPLEAYGAVIDVLRRGDWEPEIMLEEISVTQPDERSLSLLRRVISTEAGAIEHIPFRDGAIDGHMIDGAFVYRLVPKKTAKKKSG